ALLTRLHRQTPHPYVWGARLHRSGAAARSCALALDLFLVQRLQVPAGRAQHFARVRVTQRFERVVEASPDTVGDAFFPLRHRVALRRFHEVEVAELVDQPTAVPEVPVDGGQLADDRELLEAGLFRDLAQRRLLRRLLTLEVALRQS